MASLRRSCAKVGEPSELLFGVVRWVGQGSGVLDGGAMEKGFGGFFSRFSLLDFRLGRRRRNAFDQWLATRPVPKLLWAISLLLPQKMNPIISCRYAVCAERILWVTAAAAPGPTNHLWTPPGKYD